MEDGEKHISRLNKAPIYFNNVYGNVFEKTCMIGENGEVHFDSPGAIISSAEVLFEGIRRKVCNHCWSNLLISRKVELDGASIDILECPSKTCTNHQ